jgi:hypothetical protein
MQYTTPEVKKYAMQLKENVALVYAIPHYCRLSDSLVGVEIGGYASNVTISYALWRDIGPETRSPRGSVPIYRGRTATVGEAGRLDRLELPIFVDRLDRPIKFLPKCLGEEAFNWYVELPGEYHRQARIDVVLLRRKKRLV